MAILLHGASAPIHVGYVLSLFTTSFDCGYETAYHAVVWNPATLQTESVSYGDTRGDKGTAQVDAAPDVRAAYQAYMDVKAAARKAERDAEEAAREATIPRRGKCVEVFKGRKVPKGTSGRVFWYGSTAYGMRVGIETSTGEKHFTAADNVRVVV